MSRLNDYRDDVFWPDENTTLARRFEAAFYIGGIPIIVPEMFVQAAVAAAEAIISQASQPTLSNPPGAPITVTPDRLEHVIDNHTV